MSRADLLAELDREFEPLLKAVDGLTDEQMVRARCGGWSAHDILAHITGWHHEMDDALERISRGEKPALEGVDYSGEDDWNARFVETWAGTSPVAIVEELIASKNLFAAAARLVSGERFEEDRAAFRIPRGAGADHYRERALAIREWRQREGI